jgi:hypothetical protein
VYTQAPKGDSPVKRATAPEDIQLGWEDNTGKK